MKNMWIAVFIISLFLANFTSAQIYGNFSFGNLLNGVDDSTIVLGALFVIFFILINFSLSKFFKENKSVSGVLAFAISLLIVWGINRSGIGYANIFYNLFFFIPNGALETLWPLVVLGAAIILVIKYGFWKGLGVLFLGSGSIIVLLRFTNLIYESSGGLGFGAMLIILGLGFWFWGVKKEDKKKFEISY